MTSLSELGLSGATVIVPTGPGGSQAGLVAGSMALDRPFRLGASVTRPLGAVRARVLELACGLAQACGTTTPEAFDIQIDDPRTSPDGHPEPAGYAADVPAATGLPQGPVYGAKAFALVAVELAAHDEGPVVYWRTGGLPASLARLNRPVGVGS